MRYGIARQLLESTRLPPVESAAALDYSDPSAFTRAFKRWSGHAPAAWRANGRRAAAGSGKRSARAAKVS